MISIVWDHWLLDTLVSWQRQKEHRYRVPLESLEGAGEAEAPAVPSSPNKKRERETTDAGSARLAVAAYLRDVKAKSGGD